MLDIPTSADIGLIITKVNEITTRLGRERAALTNLFFHLKGEPETYVNFTNLELIEMISSMVFSLK